MHWGHLGYSILWPKEVLDHQLFQLMDILKNRTEEKAAFMTKRQEGILV